MSANSAEPSAGDTTGPRPAAASLGNRTMGAAKWRLASSAVQGGLQFGVTILLARLLPPEDFGLVALAFVVVGFATMFADVGLGPAVVQRQPLTERHVRTAFTVSLLMGAALTALLLLAAPLARHLLRDPGVVPVLRWEAWLFVFAGLGTTARALLQRALDFRRLFFVDLVSYGVGYALVSLVLALLGWGVWSLVAGALMQSLLGGLLPLLWVRHPARPLLARREIHDLMGFGVGATLNRIVAFVSLNGDNFVVGRWLGTHLLGLYSRAFQLSALPLGYVSSLTWSVLFAAYSEIRHDRARMSRAYLQAIQLTTLMGAPIMAGMVVAAPHLIVGLYGEAWRGAVVPLQILCAVAVFRTIYHASGALTHAMGKLYAELRRQLGYAALVLAGALLGTRFGLLGVSVGIAVAILYMYLAMAHLVVRSLECRWRDFFAAQLPGLALATVVAAAAWAARVVLERQLQSSVLILLGIVATCAAVLPLGIYLLPPRIRPVELFRRLESVVERLPGVIRLPVRRILRVPTVDAQLG